MSHDLNNLHEKIKAFPKTHGVYLMKDAKHVIIYVGKAKNLRSRVTQYFKDQDDRYQIRFLMNRVCDVDFLQTNTEREALLLENSLIKKHKPRYNVFLKDDKTYLGLKLTIKEPFPRLFETRKIKKDGSVYYGPFTSSEKMRDVKEFIYQHFQLRTCSDQEFANRTRPCLEYQIKRCSAPCVNYVSKEKYAEQIAAVRFFLDGKSRVLQKDVANKMNAAADNLDFEEAARLRNLLQHMNELLERQNVTQLSFEFMDVLALQRQDNKIGIAILMVRDAQLIDSKYFVFTTLEDDNEFLQNFLTQYYSNNAFIPKEILTPEALKDKDVVANLLSEHAGHKIIIRTTKRGEKHKLLQLAKMNLASHFDKHAQKEANLTAALTRLQQACGLHKIPTRMECCDISHISGKQAVGSLVAFIDGKPDKTGYRKFKIKTFDTPNDFGMMLEVLRRRFARRDGKWIMPDLLVLDGGKGQLSMALQALQELGVTGVDVIAIAKGKGEGARAKGLWEGKKEEEIFIPNRKNPVILKRGSSELMILQHLRDESHRFAITFHRQLRAKNLTHSWLDDIPGIGPKLKQKLIQKFGSAEGVRQASVVELKQIPGVTETLAKLCKNTSFLLTFCVLL